MLEKSRTSNSGFKGVYRRPNGIFLASIRRDGSNKGLGDYATAEQAALVCARELAADRAAAEMVAAKKAAAEQANAAADRLNLQKASMTECLPGALSEAPQAMAAILTPASSAPASAPTPSLAMAAAAPPVPPARAPQPSSCECEAAPSSASAPAAASAVATPAAASFAAAQAAPLAAAPILTSSAAAPAVASASAPAAAALASAPVAASASAPAAASASAPVAASAVALAAATLAVAPAAVASASASAAASPAAAPAASSAPLAVAPEGIPGSGWVPGDTSSWVRDGWMAVAGQMRQSRALLPPPPLATKRERTEEEERRAAEKAALEKARHEAETAALVVGARVEGRYQASVPGMASSSLFKNTHWFPGRIQAIDALEGTYEILYDDGDHEKGVKRRFVRLPPTATQKRERAEEEEEERRAADTAAVEKTRQAADTTALEKAGQPETAALVVGARVEGRYQASLPGIASSSLFKNTHWFPGRIQAIDALEGTYEILYDDGDHEKGVKRRFVRLMRQQMSSSSAEPTLHRST